MFYLIIESYGREMRFRSVKNGSTAEFVQGFAGENWGKQARLANATASFHNLS
jgi:hypothetical protein